MSLGFSLVLIEPRCSFVLEILLYFLFSWLEALGSMSIGVGPAIAGSGLLRIQTGGLGTSMYTWFRFAGACFGSSGGMTFTVGGGVLEMEGQS